MQFPVNLLMAGVMVILAWILNLSALCAMRSLHSRATTMYGYFSSFCVANLFLATVDFPPSIISHILVSRPLQHYLCVSWIYLDTLLSNVMIFNILGSSLDSYLRLRHQIQYVASTKDLLGYLKLCAPWTLGFIQSTSFMAIAQISESNLEDGICVILDPNFLILRSVMCFGVPISGSAILVFMSAKGLSSNFQLSSSTGPTVNRDVDHPKEQSYTQAFHPIFDSQGMVRNETQETLARSFASGHSSSIVPSKQLLDCSIDLSYFQHQCPRHGVLALPINSTIPLLQISTSSVLSRSDASICQCCSPPSSPTDYCQRQCIQMTSSKKHCPDLIPFQRPLSPKKEAINPETIADPNAVLIHQSKSIGNISSNLAEHPTLPNSQSLDIRQMSNSWNLQDNVNSRSKQDSPYMRKEDQILRSNKRTTVAINLALCIFTIICWGPFIIGSLIHGVCKPPYCMFSIATARINEFKWLSYVLCVVYPFLMVVIDADLRTEIRASLSW